MIKIAIAGDHREFIEMFRLAIKKTPPENGEEIEIHEFEDNRQLLKNFEPGKYSAAIVYGDIRSYTGDNTAHQISLADEKIIVAFYTKYNYFYTDKYDIGYYELTGKNPPDYSFQLEKIYQKLSLMI